MPDAEITQLVAALNRMTAQMKRGIEILESHFSVPLTEKNQEEQIESRIPAPHGTMVVPETGLFGGGLRNE